MNFLTLRKIMKVLKSGIGDTVYSGFKEIIKIIKGNPRILGRAGRSETPYLHFKLNAGCDTWRSLAYSRDGR